MCKEVTLTSDDKKRWQLLEKPLRTAAELGIHEIVTEIFQWHPGLIWSHDSIRKHSIFHIAVKCRYEKNFSLAYQIGSSTMHPVTELDIYQNNILRLAGHLCPSGKVRDAAFSMQKELQWFKEVEKCVQPSYREMVNTDGMTPRMVFTKEHKDLHREGEKWMKDTATSCSVVAALILTVTFAAAVTTPGGNDEQTGVPIFLNKTSFLLFAAADAIGLFSSSASLLMCLGIFSSRYSEDDFLVSLPNKLLYSLLSLFLSIAAMMVAFGATLHIVLCQRVTWIVAPIAVLSF